MSPILSYKDDSLLYQVGYASDQPRTLLADRGEIRVGQRYQAEKLPLVLEDTKTDDRNNEELEALVWTPDHTLTDKQIDQFLVVSRSIGTFARALDSSSGPVSLTSVTQPSLHMSAASASRDVTLFHAMDCLHKFSYDIATAVSALVPSSGPVLCRDEMEEWSASEANIFEEALEKYGKDFAAIRIDFLPWKTLKNVIEYYYMWKTTDRYVQFQQKRLKAAEAEAKLKQGYIPNFDKPNSNPNALSEMKRILKGNNGAEEFIGKPCESCLSSVSSQWFAWTSPSGSQARLCSQCWHYLKKFGGLKTSNSKPHDSSKSLEGDIEIVKKLKSDQIIDDADSLLGHGLQQRMYRCAIAGCNKDFKMKNQLRQHYATSHGSAVGSPRPIMKTRTAFYLHTTPLTKIARRVCYDILKRHATRSPFWPVNPGIKQEFLQRIIGKSPEDLKQIITGRKRKQPNARLSELAHRMGQPDRVTPDWLILTEKSKMPQPANVAFPKPPKGKDGSLLYERVPDKVISIKSVSPSLLKRKVYEEVGELDGLDMGQPALKKVARESDGMTPILPKSRGASPLPLTVQNLPATANARNAMHQRNSRGGVEGTKTKIASVTRVGSRKQIISWMDAPDDLYFYRTDGTRKIRRTLKSNEIRRLARSPCKKIINQAVAAMTDLFPTSKTPVAPVAPLDNL